MLISDLIQRGVKYIAQSDELWGIISRPLTTSWFQFSFIM